MKVDDIYRKINVTSTTVYRELVLIPMQMAIPDKKSSSTSLQFQRVLCNKVCLEWLLII